MLYGKYDCVGVDGLWAEAVLAAGEFVMELRGFFLSFWCNVFFGVFEGFSSYVSKEMVELFYFVVVNIASIASLFITWNYFSYESPNSSCVAFRRVSSLL